MTGQGVSVRDRFGRAERSVRFPLAAGDATRLHYHLMPPTGWLNDPNGLCRTKGTTHIFYQYAPEDPNGRSAKGWGHYVTKDYVHYQLLPIALFPDCSFDKDGAYSGSALVQDGRFHLFYTGNVKEAGVHDYILSGRRHWVCHAWSDDEIGFSGKEVVLTNAEYPDDLSCHVRDPKVFARADGFWMLLGARSRQSNGLVLVFRSDDLVSWSCVGRIVPAGFAGYMWECPDLAIVEGRPVLLVSPQGMEKRGFDTENVYQAGWYLCGEDLAGVQVVDGFRQLDHGFDFYAPQTFVDERGRCVLIGWMGMPDADYGNAPSVEHGWQHALSLPRRLFWKGEKLCQYPLEELRALRAGAVSFKLRVNEAFSLPSAVCEVQLVPEGSAWVLRFRKDVELSYKDGILQLNMHASGQGRSVRHVAVDHIECLAIFSDTSSVEIFVNGGEVAMSSRVYDDQQDLVLEMNTMYRGMVYPYGSFEIVDCRKKEEV